MCRIMQNATLPSVIIFYLNHLLWGKYKLKSKDVSIGQTHFRATSLHVQYIQPLLVALSTGE